MGLETACGGDSVDSAGEWRRVKMREECRRLGADSDPMGEFRFFCYLEAMRKPHHQSMGRHRHRVISLGDGKCQYLGVGIDQK